MTSHKRQNNESDVRPDRERPRVSRTRKGTFARFLPARIARHPKWRACSHARDRAYGYSLLSLKARKTNYLQIPVKERLCPQLFKTLSVGSAGKRTRGNSS